MLEVVVWLLYTVLLTLNILDYATTHALLTFFREKEEYGPAPPWKNTRFGKWCIRHGLTEPPETRKIEWWEHELNPFGQAIVRKTDFFGLAILKGLVLGLIAASVALNPFMSDLSWASMLLLMIDLYILVVANNVGVMRRCRLAPFAGQNES